MDGLDFEGSGEVNQHVELHPLAALLDVADGAALEPDPVPERFLVQAQVKPGAADALAELLVEPVHDCILPYATAEFHSGQHYVGQSGICGLLRVEREE